MQMRILVIRKVSNEVWLCRKCKSDLMLQLSPHVQLKMSSTLLNRAQHRA